MTTPPLPPLASVIAEKMVALGAHVIFLPPGEKGSKELNWQANATRDMAIIAERAAKSPYANVGVVGKPDGLWFFDDDEGVLAAYEAQHGLINTYRVTSASGGTHLYFRSNDASRAMGNLSEKNDKSQELWSTRVDNRYVVSAGSRAHPDNDTSKPLAYYQAVDPSAQVIEAPESFIAYVKQLYAASLTKKKTAAATDNVIESGEILEGGRNTTLTSRAGRWRQKYHWDAEQILVNLRLENERFCKPPLGDDELQSIARSIGVKPVKDERVLFGGKEHQEPSAPAPLEAAPEIAQAPHPEFPLWVLEGTSVYEGFVKPITDANSRIPYFMWFPAVAVMLNYLGGHVRVKDKNLALSSFVIIIGQKGRTIKSSSVDDAIRYMEQVGIVSHGMVDTASANGKALIWTPGSPEGLGLDMQKTNCKHPVMFYDELKTLVSKAGIDGSNIGGALLTLYESKNFSNTVKDKHSKFSHAPGTYTASLIALTTPKNFTELWSRLANGAEGLDDRFTFVYQPEVLPAKRTERYINTFAGTVITAQHIAKAVQQGVYEIDEDAQEAFQRHAERKGVSNRANIRALKYALYFAVDMGLSVIDNDCAERGIAVADYELAVKKFRPLTAARSALGAAQMKVRQTLQQQPGGRMPLYGRGGLTKAVSAMSYDTAFWYSTYEGLKRAGHIREELVGNVKFVQLLITSAESEDEDDE